MDMAARTDWGVAMREQNDDDVVRCDGCDQAGTLTSKDQPGVRPEGLRESLAQRAAWPVVPCVFSLACDGLMRREWLN